MRVQTTRFGEVEVDADALITFPEGLPGFDSKRFALVVDASAKGAVWLQSLSETDLSLLTVDPNRLGFDYQPRLKPGDTKVLSPRDGAALECRVIARVRQDGGVTLNLFAPVVINRDSGLAAQVPLVGSGYETETPWPAPEASATVPEP